MIYQHPLAYLLGMEGAALLRAWAGEQDEAFVHRRLAEIRRLLDEPALTDHPGQWVHRGDAATAYDQWSDTYDEPRNGLFDVDEPILHEILEGLPGRTVLDAACGTGRLAAQLAEQGRGQVLGVDVSPGMLARARTRLPRATFLAGTLDRLPLADASVDLIVSGLAMSHLPRLDRPFAELARVLRPGGHLVISDVHPELIVRGSVVKARGPGGEPGLAPTFRHTVGDFLRAGLAVGLDVRRFDEPGLPADEMPMRAPTTAIGPWDDWPWSLMDIIPEAMRGAGAIPTVIVWHFQRAAI